MFTCIYTYITYLHLYTNSLNSGSPGLPHSEVGVKLKPEAVAFPFATWKRVPLFAVFQMDLALIVWWAVRESTVYSIINRFLLLICQFVCVLHDISGCIESDVLYFISLWAFQFICVHMWLSFIICHMCRDGGFIWQWTKRSISSIFCRDSPIQPTGWKAGLAWSLPQSLVLPLHCAQESDYAKAVEASISCGGIWSQNLWWFGQTSTSKELETLILKASGSLGKRKPCVHPVN